MNKSQISVFRRGQATVAASGARRRRRIQQIDLSNKHGKEDFLYGLKPVDYSTPPPIAPILIPPPDRPGLQKYLSPTLILMFLGFGVYLYYNNDPEVYEYWKRVETGAIIMDDDDDDDDEDDE